MDKEKKGGAHPSLQFGDVPPRRGQVVAKIVGEVLGRGPQKHSRGSDKVSLHSYPPQRLEKDSRDPYKVSLHSNQPQRPEKSSRGPDDEVSLHSDPPQRLEKDSSDPDEVSHHSDQPQRPEKSSRGPDDEVSLDSDPPQRLEKDSRDPDEVSLHSDQPQRSEKSSRGPDDEVSLHSDPPQRLEKDSRDPDEVSLHSDQPQRPEKSSRGPDDEVSLHSDPPQRSAKDSLPKTPESSSPMTNTPKIDVAQDVFSFQRMKVSEISQLQKLPKNLHSLKIEECDVLDKIPEEVMASIPSLQRLYLINCCSLKSFPEPADLRILHIQNCKKLEFPPPAGKTNQYAFLELLCIGSSCDSLSSLPLDLFPKLRCLCIWDCKKLESLSMPDRDQKALASLEAMEIRDCPNLVYLPVGELPTPSLTSIWLSNCKNLNKLPHLLHTLGSLRSIFVNNCPELESLSDKGLPSNLGLLSITSCDKLTLTGKWELLRLDCLIKLEIEGGCKNVESFPEENLLPRNLISLRVSGLLNLKYLRYEGLQQLTTLKTLEISCCDKLESLPEGLPSSLSVLRIKECSLLKPKLQKQTGDYWPKIAHISFIETDEEVISRKSPCLKQ